MSWPNWYSSLCQSSVFTLSLKYLSREYFYNHLKLKFTLLIIKSRRGWMKRSLQNKKKKEKSLDCFGGWPKLNGSNSRTSFGLKQTMACDLEKPQTKVFLLGNIIKKKSGCKATNKQRKKKDHYYWNVHIPTI